MSFIKNMMEHDLTLLQALDGQHIMYMPKKGKSKVIDGMLQMRTAFIPGGHVEMVSTEAILSVRSVDSIDMQAGDKIAVDSNTYEITVIRADNEGITELVLEKL